MDKNKEDLKKLMKKNKEKWLPFIEQWKKHIIMSEELNLPSVSNTLVAGSQENLLPANKTSEPGFQEKIAPFDEALDARRQENIVESDEIQSANVLIESSVDDHMDDYEDLILNGSDKYTTLINQLEIETNFEKFYPGTDTLKAGRKCRFFNKESLSTGYVKKGQCKGDHTPTVASVMCNDMSEPSFLPEISPDNIMKSIQSELEKYPDFDSVSSFESDCSEDGLLYAMTMSAKESLTKDKDDGEPVDDSDEEFDRLMIERRCPDIRPRKSVIKCLRNELQASPKSESLSIDDSLGEPSPKRRRLGEIQNEESTEKGYFLPQCLRCDPMDNVKQNADMSQVFYLMSIAPGMSAIKCKDALDEDVFTWSPTFADIILVFLNWGANLHFLPITDIMTKGDMVMLQKAVSAIREPIKNKGVSSRYNKLLMDCQSVESTYIQQWKENENIPSHSNIMLVLSALEQRVSRLNISDRQRLVIIKLLIFVSVDSNLKGLTTYFYRAISAMVESFSTPWTPKLAAIMSKLLTLHKLVVTKASFVCCCLLNFTSFRLQSFGLHAACSVLQDKFRLKQFGYEPMGFLTELPSPTLLLNKFGLNDIFIMVQLLETILMRNISLSYPVKKDDVNFLNDWAGSLKDRLGRPPYYYNYESGRLRARLTRLALSATSYMQIKFDSQTDGQAESL